MTTTTTIAGTTLPSVREKSLAIDNSNNERSVASAVIQDATGLQHYQKGQQISVVDSTLGTLFAGNVNDSTESNLVPQAQINSQINAADYTSLADKRTYVDDDSRNAGQYAGTIAVDLHQRYLAMEGVVAQYAMRRDRLFADFAQGTLVNTVAANNVGVGDLELAPAGTTVIRNDGATSASSVQVLRLTGTAQQGFNPNYTYRAIWTGSVTIATGDSFEYDMWIDPGSPEIKAGVDVICSDGTHFATSALAGHDSQGLLPDPAIDLSGLADGQWYNRIHGVSGALIGKTIKTVAVVLGGSKAGLYNAYFKNIFWSHSGGNTNFFVSGPLQTNAQLSNNGYTGVTLTQMAGYTDAQQFMNTTPIELNPAQIIKSSFISWNSTELSGSHVLVETSMDYAASWQTATNNAPIPRAAPGMSVPGYQLWYRKTLYLGTNPVVAPIINSLTITIGSAPNGKTVLNDAIQIFADNESNFPSGTFTNIKSLAGFGITLNGFTRNYDDANFGSQTQFGTNPGVALSLKKLLVTALSGTDARERLDFAGTWADFTAECDMQVTTNGAVGMEYRTTNWGNTLNSFAYAVEVSLTAITLYRGANSSGVGPFSKTSIGTLAISLADASFHRLKIVASGSSHLISLDGVQLLNVTDATYVAAGNIALRLLGTAGNPQTLFDNFGVCSALSGTWISPSIDISGPGTYGTSYVWWDTLGTPDTTSIGAETSINGGSTWQAVTQGGTISGLTAGQSLVGVTLKLRMTLTSNSAPVQPILFGVTAWVVGQYSASGTRVSPALDLSPTGRAGSTLVNYTALQPAGTTLLVESSPNGSTGWVTQANGSSIAGITSQPDPTLDSFDKDTSANYLQSNFGSAGVWAWDTANSRVTGTGGSNATLVYPPLISLDGFIEIDTDQADDAGPFLDSNTMANLYYLRIWDASGTSQQNKIQLFKRVASVSSQIGSTATISFVRGTPHRIRLDVQAGVLTVLFDGVQIISFTDGSPLAAGKFGLYENSATSNRFYNIRMQPYGDLLAGKSIWTRVTLTSTDPTVSSQLQELVVIAHNPNISNGALIPKTAWQYKNQVSKCIDDLSKQSNFWWSIDPDPVTGAKVLKFLAFASIPAPWILTGNDVLVNSAPSIQNIADLYVNKVYGPGATDIVAQNKSFVGNGSATTFTLDYPVDAAPTLTLSTGGVIIPQTIGVKSVDTGKNWYYQIGSNILTQDASGIPLVALQTLNVAYNGRIPYTAIAQDRAEQTNYGLLESGTMFVMRPFGQSTLLFNPNTSIQRNSTGIVERSIDCTGLNRTAADAKVASVLARYKIRGRTFKFMTLRPGLSTGQVLSVFFTQFGIVDKAFLINRVALSFATKGDGTQLIYYSVDCSETPYLGSYIKLFGA